MHSEQHIRSRQPEKSCDMHRVENKHSVLEGVPGGFYIEDTPEGYKQLWAMLPAGIGILAAPLNPGPPVGYDWDGNADAPTLVQTITHHSGWRGRIMAGRLEFGDVA